MQGRVMINMLHPKQSLNVRREETLHRPKFGSTACLAYPIPVIPGPAVCERCIVGDGLENVAP